MQTQMEKNTQQANSKVCNILTITLTNFQKQIELWWFLIISFAFMWMIIRMNIDIYLTKVWNL